MSDIERGEPYEGTTEHDPVPRPFAEATAEPDRLERLTRAQLVTEAETAGVATTGTKAELAARIAEAAAG